MIEKYDAVIIGAGIIGCSIALALSNKSFSTLNIDSNPAAGYGSTSSSCAIIRTCYSTDHASALAFEGLNIWENWPDFVKLPPTTDLATYRQTGFLIYKTQSNGHLENIAKISKTIGTPHSHLNAAQITALLPFTDTRRYEPVRHITDDSFGEPTGLEVFGALLFPRAGYVNDPQLATRNIEQAAVNAGATFHYNCSVTQINQHGGKISGVKLSDGSAISTPIAINAAGPHSAKVNALADCGAETKITTRPVRQEVASLAAPSGFDYENKGPICIDDDVGTYSRLEAGNHMLIGTVSPSCDNTDWVDDPDAYNDSITDKITTQVMRQAQRYTDLQIPASINGLVALYDVSSDWAPIYDKSDLPGYYMAIGTSGNQFKNAPMAGQIMAQIIERCENGTDHDKHPATMHLENINWNLPLNTFSRNRPINQNSSFTVMG